MAAIAQEQSRCCVIRASLKRQLCEYGKENPMKVNALDHVNIVTDDLQGSAHFYAELLDLDVRDGPPPMRPDQVRWICDAGGRPIIHLNKRGVFQIYEREARAGPTTGAVHHVAFNCSGFAEMEQRLKSQGLEYQVNNVPSIGLTQIFLVDPNGVLLELNFYEAA
jgi:catechol 2,3-dioxygenase-like lactoylglutathione lyase family enzyme